MRTLPIMGYKHEGERQFIDDTVVHAKAVSATQALHLPLYVSSRSFCNFI